MTNALRNAHRAYRIAGCSAFALAACLVHSPAAAQERGACIVADIPAPYALPGGAVQAAGPLRLCVERVLSPVAGMHRLTSGAGETTLAFSRRAKAEAGPDALPEVLFWSRKGRPLELIGYVLPSGNGAWSFTLGQGRGTVPASLRAHAEGEQGVLVAVSEAPTSAGPGAALHTPVAP